MREQVSQPYLRYGASVVCAVVTAFAFLLVYAFNTSPISTNYGTDTAFFELVGSGMTQGLLPYRDFFDQKGPYLFIFEYIGQLLVPGREGTFVMQLLAHSVALTTLFFTVDLMQPRVRLPWKIVGALTYLYVIAFTIEGASLAEEFSLPFMMVSLYLNIRYFLRYEESGTTEYGWGPGIFQGISVGVIIFIRMTNNALTLIHLACIILFMVKHRAWRAIGQAIVSFVIGLVLACIPIVAYGVITGTFGEMMHCVFGFGFSYSQSMTLFEGLEGRLIRSMLMLAIPVIAVACVHPRTGWMWLLVLTGVSATIIVTLLGRGYLHYAALDTPLLVLALAIMCRPSEDRFAYARVALAAVLCTGILLVQWPLFDKVTHRAVPEVKRYLFESHENVDQAAVDDVARFIPEDERSSVYCYGFSRISRWYLMSGIYPCIRYADFQGQHSSIDPSIPEEVRQRFEEDPPLWIVTGPELPDNNLSFIGDYLKEEYHEVHRNEMFVLYQRVAE